MEQAESPSELEENAESPKCCESLAPALVPLLPDTGTAMAGDEQPVTQLCHALLRRWQNLQPDTKQRLRSHLCLSNASKDNVVTIELSDEDDDDEVLEQSNTKAETALGYTLQKDGEVSKIDLVIKDVVTMALSAKELEVDVATVDSDVMQKNHSEDMTTNNIREAKADDENPSRNGDDEMYECVVKEKNNVSKVELQVGRGNVQNFMLQSFSKEVMPIVSIPEQETGNEDLRKRVDTANCKRTVHPIRNINIDTLHLFEDKPHNEIKRDQSKLLPQYKHRVVSKDNFEQNIVKHNPRKRSHTSKNLKTADPLIIKKKISSKRQKIRTKKYQSELMYRSQPTDTMISNDVLGREHGYKDLKKVCYGRKSKSAVELIAKNTGTLQFSEGVITSSRQGLVELNNSNGAVVNNNMSEEPDDENIKLVVREKSIGTSRVQMETRVTRNDSVQPNHSKEYITFDNISDQELQTFRKDCAVGKSNSVKSNKRFNENSQKVSENNNLNITLNAYDDLDDIYRLFSSPKSTVLGEYLRIERDPGLKANILGDNSVNINITGENQGDKNTPSQESNILKDFQEIGVSDIVAVIDFDSDDENKNSKNKYIPENRSDRVIKTYSAFRRNKTQGHQETTNIVALKTLQADSREKSWTLNINNVIKTYKGKRKRSKWCDTLKNAFSKSAENNDATIPKTSRDNTNEGVKNNYPVDPELLIPPVDVIRKLTDQICNERSLKHPSRSPTPIYDLTTPPRSPARQKSTSPLMSPRNSPYPSTVRRFSTAGPKSKKLLKSKEKQINAERNERSSMKKTVELPDIEEVRHHNRNMLTAQVTPNSLPQGGLIAAVSCGHNKFPNTSSSTASLEGCSRCAAHGLVPPDDTGVGKQRRDAASRARSFITSFATKRKYILSQQRVKHRPAILDVKPYHRNRKRRRRPYFTSGDNVSSDLSENMPTRDLIILENDPDRSLDRSSNSAAHFETVTSNDAPSNQNENLTAENLILQNKEDAIHSFQPITQLNSDDAPAALIGGSSAKNDITVQKEQEITRSFNPVADFESILRNDDLSDLVEGVTQTQILSNSHKEQGTARHLKRVTFSIPMQDEIATQKEQETTSVQPVKIGVNSHRKQNQRNHKCSKSDNASSIFDESEPMRDLIILENSHDSLSTASFNAVPVSGEGVSTRELTTTQSIQETDRSSKRVKRFASVPSIASPISNKCLPTKGPTIGCYRSTCTFEFFGQSANDSSVVNNNIPTRDVIMTQKDQETALKRATRIASVPSSPAFLNDQRDVCKHTVQTAASLNERRNTTDSMLHASMLKTKNVKVYEEHKRQKQSDKFGFKPLLYRKGSVSKDSWPMGDFASCCKQETTNFGTEKDAGSWVDSDLAKNRARSIPSIIPISTKENRNIKPVSNNCFPSMAESNQFPNNPEFVGASEAMVSPVIVNIQYLASQVLMNASITPAPETIVQSKIPTITLKRAQRVYASYLPNSSNKRQHFTPEDLRTPQDVKQHFPKVVDVASAVHLPSASTFNRIKVPSVGRSSVKSPLPTILSRINSSSKNEHSSMDLSLKPKETRHLPNEVDLSTVTNLTQTFEQIKAESVAQVSVCKRKSLPVITLKQAKPVCILDLTNSLNEIHDLTSDSMEPIEMTQQFPKIIDVSSLEANNFRENSHNRDAALKGTIPSNSTSSSEKIITRSIKSTHLPKVIRELELQSQQIDGTVETLGPQTIQPKALPKITLKRAQPVYVSHSSNDMEILISGFPEEVQDEHLPRVGDVTGNLHVMQPDDQMGLHLVVSQEEVCNDNLHISPIFR